MHVTSHVCTACKLKKTMRMKSSQGTPPTVFREKHLCNNFVFRGSWCSQFIFIVELIYCVKTFQILLHSPIADSGIPITDMTLQQVLVVGATSSFFARVCGGGRGMHPAFSLFTVILPKLNIFLTQNKSNFFYKRFTFLLLTLKEGSKKIDSGRDTSDWLSM
jgi:hypothetical protein